MKNQLLLFLFCTTLSFSFRANAYQALVLTQNTQLNITSGANRESIDVTTPSGIDSATNGDTEHHINIQDTNSSIITIANDANISTSGNNASVIFLDNLNASDRTNYNNLTINNIGSLLTSGTKAVIHEKDSINGSVFLYNSGSIKNTNNGTSEEGVINIDSGNVTIYNDATGIISSDGNKGVINITNITDINDTNTKTTEIVNYGSLINNNSSLSEGLINVNGGNTSIIQYTNGTITANGTKAVIDIVNTNNGITSIENSGTISATNTEITKGVINILGGSANISNLSGTISAADANDNAIFLDSGLSGNLKVTVNSDSVFSGKISSGGAKNVIAISESGTITGSAYKALFDRMRSLTVDSTIRAGSSWSYQLVSGTLVSEDTDTNADDIVINGGNLSNNSGTLDKVLFTSGTITSGGTISDLQFDTTGAYGNIASTTNGSVNLNVDSANVTYGNELSGNGALIKSGASRLSITGNSNTHSGTFDVAAGELKINGTTASQVIVEDGALLTGSGSIGSLNVQSGATLASGNSIGTMNVVGNITLNSGSTDLIEYNNVAMGKTQTTNGNISVAGNAIFNLFNYPDGNFVVSQNILETTNGIRTGTFDSTSTTNSNYIVSTDYTAKAVRATVSRKLNASTLDAPLAIQNSIGRLMNKSLADQLQAYSDSNKEKAAVWVSYNSFNGNKDDLENSSNYSFSGDLKSVGIVKKAGSVDLIASAFNSQSSANRSDYFGKDKIETNGGSIGLGMKYKMPLKTSLYSTIQLGFGAYNSHNRRGVGVNGLEQAANSESKGSFKQISIGTTYNVPTSKTGKFTFSVLVGVQETKNNGFNENGLSYGNLNVSESRAKNFNYEIGLGYQNEFAKMFMLPSKSSYRVELTGYQSNLYAKDNATATQGNASYLIAARYNQNFIVGTNISATLPITEATRFSGKFTRRENGNFKESIVGAELKHQF
jgi:uncharacterized protein with beta-barrel porin domain